MSKLIEFYTNILTYCKLKVDKSGTVYTDSTGKRIPILIDEKEVVLPTQDNLRSPDIMNKIIFHPIPENISRGESPVIRKLLQVINTQINLSTSVIMSLFIQLMHSSMKEKNLNPDQSELISQLGSIDKSGFMNLTNVIKKGMAQNASRFVTNIFLKQGGQINGKRYSRVGIVTFPLYEMATKEEDLFGVKLRTKDYEALVKMISLIFPDCNIKYHYSRGSDNDFIPYLESMLMSSLALVSRVNDIIELFRDQLEDLDTEPYDASFYDNMSMIDDIINEARRIPSQPGNVADAQSLVQQPMVPQQSLMTPQGQWMPPQMVQPRAVINQDNTVDFASVLMSNPAMSMQQLPQTPFGPPMVPMAMQSQRPVATWLANYQTPMQPMMGMQPFAGQYPIVQQQVPMPQAYPTGRANF